MQVTFHRGQRVKHLRISAQLSYLEYINYADKAFLNLTMLLYVCLYKTGHFEKTKKYHIPVDEGLQMVGHRVLYLYTA